MNKKTGKYCRPWSDDMFCRFRFGSTVCSGIAFQIFVVKYFHPVTNNSTYSKIRTSPFDYKVCVYNVLTLVMLNKLTPLPLLILSQSDYLIQIVAINSHTKWQTVQIQIWRSQLIWIYTVCKNRAYLGSAGQGLKEWQTVKALLELLLWVGGIIKKYVILNLSTIHCGQVNIR